MFPQIISFLPWYYNLHLGLLPPSECKKTECTQAEENDPAGNNCYIKDGYNRTMLYRTWRPACSDFHVFEEKLAAEYLSYILDHSDTYHYGSKVVIRCLPGFMLPSTADAHVSKLLDIGNIILKHSRYFYCRIF